jgi:hypothetical protein
MTNSIRVSLAEKVHCSPCAKPNEAVRFNSGLSGKEAAAAAAASFFCAVRPRGPHELPCLSFQVSNRGSGFLRRGAAISLSPAGSSAEGRKGTKQDIPVPEGRWKRWMLRSWFSGPPQRMDNRRFRSWFHPWNSARGTNRNELFVRGAERFVITARASEAGLR